MSEKKLPPRKSASKSPSVRSVEIRFSGFKSGEMAGRFFTYLVDGGLEDHLIQALSGDGVTLEIGDCDSGKLSVTFDCRETQQIGPASGKPGVKPSSSPPGHFRKMRDGNPG